MTTARRRANRTYLGSRVRGTIYTGRPGAPKYATLGMNRVNKHDHSGTAGRRRSCYGVTCCGLEQAAEPGVRFKCGRCS